MDRLPAPREIEPSAVEGRRHGPVRAWRATAARPWSAAPAAVLALGLVACGSGSEDPARRAADGSDTPAATATITGGEVKLVSAVRPKVDALVDALQDGDLSRARAAFADYDAAWNGVEVYVNVRDLSLYEKLEDDLQSPIGDALEGKQPDLAAQVATAKALRTTFDQAIDNSKDGPALSPLFDDVTALRIVRSDLRRATDLLEADDVQGARKRFTTFRGNYALVQQRVRVRSDVADAQLVAAIAAAAAAFEQPKTSAASISPLVAAVTDRYGFALGLWNAAARNADGAKDAWTPADLAAVGELREVEAASSKSVEEWGEGEYDEAVAQVTTASQEFEEAEPALTGKNSDSAKDSADGLESALANLRAVVSRDGSDAVVAAAARAVDEAARIAEQVVVGQFWTDAALQSEIAEKT